MIYRSEGFPERDIWSLGTLDQGSARCAELLGRRRRRHLETQVDIQARKLLLLLLLLLKVFLRFWGRSERYLENISCHDMSFLADKAGRYFFETSFFEASFIETSFFETSFFETSFFETSKDMSFFETSFIWIQIMSKSLRFEEPGIMRYLELRGFWN